MTDFLCEARVLAMPTHRGRAGIVSLVIWIGVQVRLDTSGDFLPSGRGNDYRANTVSILLTCFLGQKKSPVRLVEPGGFDPDTSTVPLGPFTST